VDLEGKEEIEVVKLSFGNLAQKIDGTLLNKAFVDSEFNGLSIDSRTVSDGELFTAIKGAITDGHKYIDGAVQNKCSGLLINKDYNLPENIISSIPVVSVDDTHVAIKRLAHDYLNDVNPVKAGITGSNGKTTSKDTTFSIISSVSAKTYCSPGNLNNLYGLPLSIFKMPNDTKTAIFELGISEPGEMTELTKIMTPDLALITNVGPTHLETLGSVEGVAEAKLELADAMDKQKPVLINADNELLIQAAKKRSNRFITFGIKNDADFTASPNGLTEDGYPSIIIDDEIVVVPLFGEHQIYNVLAGYAVAKTLGFQIDPQKLNAIEYNFAQYRGQIESVGDYTIIADCYNANPTSLKSGLNSFYRYKLMTDDSEERSVVVIGDMLELGGSEKKLHEEIGSMLAEMNFDLAITVGSLSKYIYDSAIANGVEESKIENYENAEVAAAAISSLIKPGDAIYFKASRGIGLETIIKRLKKAAVKEEQN